MKDLAKLLEETIRSTDNDPSWQALYECQIMLPLGQLLQLVRRFTKGLKSTLSPQNSASTPTFFTNPCEGPIVVGTNSPVVTVIIKGNKVPGTSIDDGSGMNVIS